MKGDRFLESCHSQNLVLRRLVWLGVMSAVLAGALVYPMRLPNIYLLQLDMAAEQSRGRWGEIYFGQLRSFVAFNHSPLRMKECFASAYLLASICFFLLYLVRTIGLQLSKRCVDPLDADRKTSFLAVLKNPLAWLGTFLVYAALSTLFVSPTINHSLWTLLMCALGAGAFWMLIALRPTWDEIAKFMVGIALAGTAIAFISFLQHVDAAWWFLPKFDDPRNRVGSLIGHNTGLSAFLLFPLAFAVSFWFLARSRLVRVAAGAAIGLIVFVLIAAQSRAIWVLGPAMLLLQCLVLARGLHGPAGARRVVWGVLAVLALLFLVQMVAPRVNPLARHTVRLTERLQRDLSPRQLLKETRLRILVVSSSLIARSPLIGHGFGSFQFVYPPAHGQYFLRHPDSVLGTTIRRTDVAHNDYLQLLVETGLLGGALLFVALAKVVSTIARSYRAMPWGREKVLWTGLVCPLAAMAAQAALDFPMHIYPIALTTVTTLALAYAAALWPRRQTCWASAAADEVAPPLPEPKAEGAPQPSGRLPVRSAMVAALVVGAMTWLGSPLAFEFLTRVYVSDILERDAGNWVSTAREYADSPGWAKYRALSTAKELYRRAIKVHIFNGLAMEGMASACLLGGIFDYALWRDLSRDDPNAKSTVAAKQTAIRGFSSAINYAKLAIEKGELRYHYLYFVIGQAYHMLWKLEPGTAEYLTSARRALERAIELNNADVASLQELADVYEELSPPDLERARALRRRIFEVDPEFGATRFLAPVDSLALRGKFASAWRSFNKIAEAVGDHWSVQFAKARLYLREALWPPPALDVATTSPERRQWFRVRYDLARPLLQELQPKLADNPVFRRFQLDFLAAGGETTAALALADELVGSSERRDPELDVLRHELALRVGTSRPLRWVVPQSAEFWYYRQRLRTLWLGPIELGSAQLANLAKNDKNLRLQLDEGLRAAAFLQAAGRMDLLRDVVDNLALSYPSDPDVRELASKVAPRPTAASPARPAFTVTSPASRR